MTNALFQAAYLKSKLAKYSDKADELTHNLSNLIESLIKEAKSGQKVNASGQIQTVREEDEDSSLDAPLKKTKKGSAKDVSMDSTSKESSVQ